MTIKQNRAEIEALATEVREKLWDLGAKMAIVLIADDNQQGTLGGIKAATDYDVIVCGVVSFLTTMAMQLYESRYLPAALAFIIEVTTGAVDLLQKKTSKCGDPNDEQSNWIGIPMTNTTTH